MLVARLPEAFKVEYLDWPTPEISDDQVLLKNIYLGVCASDIQIYHGKHKYMKFPLVMGHEASCEVVKVGKNVTDFNIGDRVVLQPQVVCGKCFPCSIGRFNVCEHLSVIGVHQDGCACEYIAVNPWNLHKIPDMLPYDVAALVEPLAVGVGSVKRAPNYKGANIVIVGAGTIGNLTAQAAKAMEAGKVMITDIIDKKLNIAERCGVDYCINTSNISLKDAIDKCFGSFRKADIIIDCAGSTDSFNSIMAAARKRSNIVISGNYKEPVQFDVPVIQRSEINIIGHMMYIKEDFQDALQMLNNRQIASDMIITQHFPLSQYGEAFKFIDEHPQDTMKVLIDIA